MHPAAWAVLSAMCGVFAPSAAAFEFAPPGFLAPPSVSRSAYGVIYDYRGRTEQPDAALQIMLIELPGELRTTASRHSAECLSLFVREMQRHAPDLFVQPVGEPLPVGPLNLHQARWLRRLERRDMTGVTACGVAGGRYVSIRFEDSLQGAIASFPSLRARLRGLTLP